MAAKMVNEVAVSVIIPLYNRGEYVDNPVEVINAEKKTERKSCC